MVVWHAQLRALLGVAPPRARDWKKEQVEAAVTAFLAAYRTTGKSGAQAASCARS
jgi:hypothetical protein